MRVDGAGPRSWLLAVVAGWAVLAWMLALAGLGGHIRRLPEDPSLSQPLPQPHPAAAPRLGPLGQYAEIGARPLFSDDRRPKPFVLNSGGDDEGPASFEFVLTSVLLTPTLKMAIVQPGGGGEPIRMKLGEAPEEAKGWRLVALNPRSAIFEGPEGQRTLDLRVYDGTGGEPPTSIHPEQPTATQPVAQPAAAPTPPEAAPEQATDAATKPAPAPVIKPEGPAPTPEQRMQEIRKRIEARRAQLREEARRQQSSQPPAQNP